MDRLPLLSCAFESWDFATRAYACEGKKSLSKQQWKSFWGAFLHSKFATKWFRILKSPDFVSISYHRPLLYFKPFRVYMSIRWSKQQRMKVILDTYKFINAKGSSFAEVIHQKEGIEMSRFKLSDELEGVLKIGYDDRYRKEGELVFSFDCEQLGGMIISAAVSFEETAAGVWVCRIGCVQGHIKNAENATKVTQKLMHGLRPKALIVFTIQEFSRQMGFSAVYGAGDSIQAYRKKHAIHLPWRHNIQFDYDAIWMESGGIPAKEGWYELPLVPLKKSYEEIKTHKRAVYKRRYQLMDELSDKIGGCVKRLA